MKTIKLHSQDHPNAPLYIFLGVIALLFVVNAASEFRVYPKPQAEPTPALSSFIMVIATRQPEPRQQVVIERVVQVVVTATPQPVEPQPVYRVMAQPTPVAGYVAHTTAGDIVVPDNATPVPEGASYTGPFLVPVVTPPSGPRVCTGFHDWRDYDAMYAASPACHT